MAPKAHTKSTRAPDKSHRSAPVVRGRTSFAVRLRKNWQLHLMFLLPALAVMIFYYGPMLGLQIAFRDFRSRAGIWHSPWVGLKHFEAFFKTFVFTELLTNTLLLSLYSIFAGFPLPIILALLLHVSPHKRLRKATQNVSYIPHFISVVVLVGILNRVLNPYSGLVGSLYQLFGGVGIPKDIRGEPDAFRHLYVWSGIWQNMGWSSIVYISALSGVSEDLHEAAELDGASRWQRLLHVDLPAILPTVAIMLILRCGSVMSIGYEKVFLMQNELNLTTSEVISTYVYKTGLGYMKYSYGTAVDLFNSVVNTTLLVLVNIVSRKSSDGELGLF